jgi:hypothetical protein
MLSAHSENTRKVFKRIWRIWRIVSEYAERIYAYMEKMQRDTKLRISWLIVVCSVPIGLIFYRKREHKQLRMKRKRRGER